MNVFIIPSWYPSAAQPHTGIFNKEQAEALAHFYPSSHFAISTWGSHEPGLLLWAHEPFKNVAKLGQFLFRKPRQKKLSPNLTEFFSPAFSWSRRFLQGNIRGIIKVNEDHLIQFQAKTGKADILHAHSAYPGGWVAMVLGKKYGIPYIITEQMSPFPFESFLTKKGTLSHYLRLPFKHAYCTIAVSPQQQKTLSEWEIPGLRHIPNLTDEEYFKPLKKRKEKSGAFTFFTLGRQEPQKGIPYLLQAFKKHLESQPDSLLRIGGDGSERKNYQKLALELNISEKTEWLGMLSRPEALKEIQQCDVFVLPSLHENLPLVLLEATACGKPVIGTRCGGSESIINAKNGVIVEKGNIPELARALLFMNNHHQQYSEEEIRADFCSRYSRSVICSQIMEVYHAARFKRHTDV